MIHIIVFSYWRKITTKSNLKLKPHESFFFCFWFGQISKWNKLDEKKRIETNFSRDFCDVYCDYLSYSFCFSMTTRKTTHIHLYCVRLAMTVKILNKYAHLTFARYYPRLFYDTRCNRTDWNGTKNKTE